MHIRAVLSEEERNLIFTTTKDLKITGAILAKLIGVNRTYLYDGLSSKQLELSKVLKIQRILGLKFFRRTDIESATQELGKKLIEMSNILEQ